LPNKETVKEVLARLDERIKNLSGRFDGFEKKQDSAYQLVIENQKSINDLSHVVKAHQDKFAVIDKEESEKKSAWRNWKLALFAQVIILIATLVMGRLGI